MANDIPSPTQKNLDLLSPDSNGWQKDFYERQIKAVIPVHIQFDHPELTDLELAETLQAFIHNWSTQEDNGNQLLGMLKNFEAVQQQSLPGIVTRKFSGNADLKKTFEETYQRIVLLEIVYHIEALHAKQSAEVASDPKWQALLEWAQKQKNTFTPSWLNYWPNKIKSLTVGDFFENAFLWATQTVPYFIKLFLKNLVHSARRFPNLDQSKKQNVANIFFSTFQSSFILLSLVWSINVQIRQVLGQLTSLPFILLRSLFKNYPRVVKQLDRLNFIKNVLLFFTALAYTSPYLSAAIFYGVTSAFVALTVGPLVLLAQTIAQKVFNQDLDLTENEEILMPGKEFGIVIGSTLLTSFTPTYLNPLIDTGSALFEDFKHMEAQFKELMNVPHQPRESLTRDDRVLYVAITTGLLDDTAKIIRRNTGNNWLQENRNEWINILHIYFELDAEEAQDNIIPDPASQTAEPEAAPYDKNDLIVKLMRMNAQKGKIQAEDPALAEELEKAKNPHTYLANFKTIKDLPETLRKLAKPIAPKQPTVIIEEAEEDMAVGNAARL